MEKLEAKRILVRCPNWVGDVVMATPVFRCIRENYPDAYIAAVVKSYCAGVLAGVPWVDEVVAYDPGGAHRGLLGYWRFAKTLRERRFDFTVLLPHSFSSAWMAFLGGAKRRVGYDRGDRWWLLTAGFRPPREEGQWMPVPKTQLYLDLCRHLGLTVGSPRTKLFVSSDERRRAEELLQSHGVTPDRPVVVLNPGAKFGSSKCWPPERFARVSDLMVDAYDCASVVTCGPGEESIGQAIEAAAERPLVSLSPADVPLTVLKAIIARCSLLITNDTGPRHFGVALDKPVVVIMGSTDPRHTACNLEKTIVVREDVECGPCHLKTCPTDHRCMTLITPERVLQAAEELMEKWGVMPEAAR